MVDSTTIASEIGQRIARHRKRAGMSQTALAAAAGLHRTNVWRFETGENVPKIDTLYRIADALGVLPWSLLPEPEPSSNIPPGGWGKVHP